MILCKLSPAMDNKLKILDELHANKEYFLSRVQQELKRAQRYLSFISYIRIDTSRLSKSGEINHLGPNNDVHNKLRSLIRKSLRQTDIISGFNDGKICLLLVETHKDGAEKVKERLQESIKYFLHEMFNSPVNWKVDFKIGSFPDGSSSPNSFYKIINSAL
jgi:GGDEF domain-containing protein